MRSALGDAGLQVLDSAPATITVHSSEEQASLIVRVSGEEILRRQVGSNDCSAVAEAFALIAVDALASLLPIEVAAIDTAPEIATATPLGEQKASDDHGLVMGIIAGFGTSSNSSTTPSFAQIDLLFERNAYKLRAAVWADSEESFGQDLNRQQYGARVEVGPQFGGQYWLRPTVGIGLVASQVTSTLAERQELTRLHPILVSTISAGLRLSSSLSLRADLRGLWYPIADRYVSAMQSIGESPRSMVSAGLGFEWSVD